MIGCTRRALRQVDQLIQRYENRERYEAMSLFRAALYEAEPRIESSPADDLRAPRPDPELARKGWARVKAGRYWIAYRRRPRLTIVAVFFETADIPARL